MFKLVLRNLRQRPLRYVLTGLAITFGVAAVTAVFVFTDGLRDTFDELAGNIQAGFDVAVQNEVAFGDGSSVSLVPIELAGTLASIEGVNSVQPRIIDFSTVAIDGNGDTATGNGPSIGLNWEYETPNPRLFAIEGKSPDGPGQFAIDVDGYANNDFEVGETYRVITPAGSDDYELVGTFNYADEEENAAVGAVLIAFAPETALEILNNNEGYNDITLTSDDPDALVERLTPLLAETSDTLVARTQADLIEDQQDNFGQILGIFRTVLLVFAVIILLVSAFLIFNVFNITLGQRIKELGLLRSIGALGSQVTNMMLGEAMFLGVLATIVGIPAGWVLANILRFGLSQAGFPGDTGLPINPLTILYAIGVGVVVTVLAALTPSIRARRVSPMSALRDDINTTTLDSTPAPLQGALSIVLGLALVGLGFLLNGWLPRLFLPLAGGILLYIGVRFIGPALRDFAPFVLLLYGLILLTIVRFGDFSVGETFGLLGAGAALTILGFSQVSPVFGAPVSRLIGSKPSAVVVGIVGALIGIAALAMIGFGIVKAVDGSPAFLALFIPAVVLALLSFGLVRTVIGAMGLTGRLARENAARNPQRTATTATALMIGLALVTAVTVIGDSIKTSVSNALGSSVTADWLVQGPQSGPAGLPFSADVAERLRELPEVDTVSSVRFSFAGYASVRGDDVEMADVQAAIPQLFGALAEDDKARQDQIVANLGADAISVDTLLAADFTIADDHVDPDFVERDRSLDADGNGVWIDDGVAADRGLALGDSFFAVFLDGAVEELTVSAIYTNAFVYGDRVIDLALWERHTSDDTDAFVSIITTDGVDSEVARAAINNEINDDYPLLTVQDRSEFAEEQEAQINQTLATVNVLLALSALIAILGIAIALSLAVFERTREIGLLRAVGMTRQQTRWMIRWEGVIVAAFGGLLGVILGIGLGVLATGKMPEFLVNTTTIPVGQLLIYIIVAAITGLGAAVFPAWIAGRMNVLDSISTS